MNEPEVKPLNEPVDSPDIYPVYPESDEYDRPVNPYSQH
jgi:hypothetical protein